MQHIKELVEDLPEVYQNIYGHSEFDADSSRNCEVRKEHIINILKSLQNKLNKSNLKVLDLGCAQGFYSFCAAEIGCEVDAVDYLDKNIALCNALVKENKLNCTFREEKISMEMVDAIEDGAYDAILFFSVVHHISNEHGFNYARTLFEKLFSKASVVLTELAIKEEPVFWNVNLPDKYQEWFENVAFYDEQGFFSTHLSEFRRPLLFSSNQFCYVNNQLYTINRYLTSAYKEKAVDLNRRYYICEDDTVLIKCFCEDAIEQFKEEIKNEISFLKTENDFSFVPRLLYSKITEQNIIEVTRIRLGELLYNFFDDNKEINVEGIFQDILSNCVQLEKKGYYHTDLRPWNVCVDKNGSAFLIDFGAISNNKYDHVLQGQYYNRDNALTVYDSFIALLYDTLLRQKYRFLSSVGVYQPSLYFEFEKIPEEYSIFIKKYLISEDNTISFSYLMDLYQRYVVEKERIELSNEEKIIVLRKQLSALQRKKLDEIEYRAEIEPWRKNVDAFVIDSIEKKKESDIRLENVDKINENYGRKISELERNLSELERNLSNNRYDLENGLSDNKRELDQLKQKYESLRADMELFERWIIYRGYKRIRDLFRRK